MYRLQGEMGTPSAMTQVDQGSDLFFCRHVVKASWKVERNRLLLGTKSRAWSVLVNGHPKH